MPFASIDGRNFHYLDQGSGFPLLLGHSYLFDHSMWQAQVAALASHYRVIVPDLWGHGASAELPVGRTSLVDLAADHLQLMTHLGIDRFAIVGLSVGGMWGAELAALAAERVKALVLLDTYLGAESAQARAQYFAMLDAVEAAGTIRSPILEYICAQFHAQHVPAALQEVLRERLQNLSAENLRESIVPLGRIIFGREDRLSVLQRIAAPALVLTGELDRPRPPAEGQEMAELLGARHEIIANAGHISAMDQAERVTELLLAFLARQLG